MPQINKITASISYALLPAVRMHKMEAKKVHFSRQILAVEMSSIHTLRNLKV
jgi:hypothetical protein